MQSYRHFPLLTMDKKENCQEIRKLGDVFHNRLRLLLRKDLGDLQIDLYVSLHDGVKIHLAGIVPVFLEFNGLALQLSEADTGVAMWVKNTRGKNCTKLLFFMDS